jgi:hypothetical protein
MTARFTSPLRGRSFALFALAITAMVATTAHADTIIFQSDLSNVTTPSPSPNGRNFQLNYNGGSVAGITNTNTGGILGYNFVYAEGTPYFSANLTGASNNGGGSATRLASSIFADPFDTQDHGAFLALDSVYQTSAIQILFSTILGQTYSVSFDWGGTQQVGYTGASTDYLSVALNGGQTQTTTPVAVAEQGFSGWKQVTNTFVATTTGTSVLTFLAGGTPVGADQQPAMTLLDNITISQTTNTPVPEPGSLMLLSTGLIGVGSYVRTRYNKSKGTNL